LDEPAHLATTYHNDTKRLDCKGFAIKDEKMSLTAGPARAQVQGVSVSKNPKIATPPSSHFG